MCDFTKAVAQKVHAAFICCGFCLLCCGELLLVSCIPTFTLCMFLLHCLHAWDAVGKHGLQVLLNNRPEATTALLMQLCTPGDSSKPDGDWIAKVSDFAHLAADRFAFLQLASRS
jgi:hypothetical protein